MSERETNLNLSADDRGTWGVFTDDPVMIAKMEKVGAEFVRDAKGGEGKFFKLRADQVVIRTGKRFMSEEDKVRRVAKLHAHRRSHDGDVS